jgi:hypothetical protein
MFDDFRRRSQHTEALSEGMAIPRSLASPTAARSQALPAYIKPLPARFGQDDITYLRKKGVLAIPDQELRNELLRSYAEYMHPFMPLLDWHEFVRIIDQNNGAQSVSLLLFQAVMFTGTATVEMRLLKAAGYSTRREARRDFFNKTRLLYDFDYEDDSITLIQALLLMTYWKERPNSRKETHHWIEIAVSLSHEIGLHRNPEESMTLEPWRKKLWKRIWWSVCMRDSQIALGTPRSTGMKDVDFDVPMLQLTDFEMGTVPSGSCCMPADCKVARDTEMQRQLALMCIEMAKLCMCIRHILSVQYGLPSSKGSTRTATMIFAESLEPGDEQIQDSAKVLQQWKDRLPEEAQYVTPTRHDVDSSNTCLVLHRAFLHMLFYAALSSLHRWQLLPSAGMLPRAANADAVDVDVSRKAIRHAATKITEIASTLHNLDLVRYLPSPTITVLLPAIVVHLLEVLAPSRFLHLQSLQDFCKCMQIMAALRDMHAAADYSTAFLQAAIERTEIWPASAHADEDRESSNIITSTQGLTGAGQRAHFDISGPESGQLAQRNLTARQINGSAPASDGRRRDDNTDRRMNSSLVSAEPSLGRHFSYGQHVNQTYHYSQNLIFDAVDTENDASPNNLTTSDGATMIDRVNDFELDYESPTNLGAARMTMNAQECDFGAMQGESVRNTVEMDWLMGMGAEGLMLVRGEGGSAMF